MSVILWIIGIAAVSLSFVSTRVWLWAKGPVDTPPPRDVRLWVRIFAPEYRFAMDHLWPCDEEAK